MTPGGFIILGMGWNPETETLELLTPEYLAAHPEAAQWDKFREGDVVLVKPQVDMGRPAKAKFRIESIGGNRMVLVAVGTEKIARQELIETLKAKIAELEKA